MKEKTLGVSGLSFMLFLTVFGFSNIPNNYADLGAGAVFWWIALAIFFVPFALMMAEMASTK